MHTFDTTDQQRQPRYAAMIALSQDSLPPVEAVAGRLAALWPQIAPATDRVEAEAGIALTLEGSSVSIVRRSGAVVVDAQDSPAPRIKSPLSAAALEHQQAHLVIGAHHADAIAAAIVATRVTAAIVECCPRVIAIYWPAACHWLTPRGFVERARDQLQSGRRGGDYCCSLRVRTSANVHSFTSRPSLNTSTSSLGCAAGVAPSA